MSTVAQGKDDYILVLIWITVWIQEFLKRYFIIALIGHILEVLGLEGGLLSAGVFLDYYQSTYNVFCVIWTWKYRFSKTPIKQCRAGYELVFCENVQKITSHCYKLKSIYLQCKGLISLSCAK